MGMDKKKLKSILLILGIVIVWATLFYTQEIKQIRMSDTKPVPPPSSEIPFIEIE